MLFVDLASFSNSSKELSFLFFNTSCEAGGKYATHRYKYETQKVGKRLSNEESHGKKKQKAKNIQKKYLNGCRFNENLDKNA